MVKKIIIAVVGHGEGAAQIHEEMAYEVGKEIAKAGAVLLCGGRKQGTMDAAAKGCSEGGGISVGILPESDLSLTSKYIDIPILTGIGFARNQIIAFSADAMIVVGGGVGALTEVAYAYAYGKPIIFMKGSGGMIEPFVNKYMDGKKKVRILEAENAKKAVSLALNLIKKRQG